MRLDAEKDKEQREESLKFAGNMFSHSERTLILLGVVIFLGGIALGAMVLRVGFIPGHEELSAFCIVLCTVEIIFSVVMALFVHIFADMLQHLRLTQENANEIRKALQTRNTFPCPRESKRVLRLGLP